MAVPPDLAHLGLLDGVRFRPVFIMGNARSGTTILYQLLVATGRFNWVSAYHVLGYDALVDHHLAGTTDQAKRALAERFARLGIPAARFDGVGVSPDSPEEYGFALTDGHLLRLGDRTLPRFVELCRKVQLVSQPGRPLLLKNPWDYASFLRIKREFPDSKFIFLHRNPAATVQSMLAGLQTLLAQKNAYHALVARFYDRMMARPLHRALVRKLFSPALGLGPWIMGWHVRRTARYFLDNVGRLPATDHVSLRYEDLCADPEREVDRILDFLGLERNPAARYRDLVRPPRTPSAEPSPQSLLRRPGMQPYLHQFGYDEVRPS